jgi:hypothetical protein
MQKLGAQDLPRIVERAGRVFSALGEAGGTALEVLKAVHSHDDIAE